MATIKDLARSIAVSHDLKGREAEMFVSAIVDTILEGLEQDRVVKIKGFGTFKLTAVKDRESVNVNTGERVVINGHDKISFTPDNTVRDLINKPFVSFDTVILSDSVDFDSMEFETPEQMEDSANDDIELSSDAAGTEVEAPETIEAPEIVDALEIVDAPETIETPEPIETPETIEVPEHIETPEENTMEIKQESPTNDIPEVVAENTANEPVENVSAEQTETAAASESKEPAVAPRNPYAKPPVLLIDDEEEEEEEIEEDSSDTISCKKACLIYAIFLNTLLVILAYCLGYYNGENLLFGRILSESAKEVSIEDSAIGMHSDSLAVKHIVDSIAAKEAVEQANAKADSIKAVVDSLKNLAEKQREEAEKANAETAKAGAEQKNQNGKDSKTDANQKKSNIQPETYNSDPRVRTGAYVIVGVAQTVTVGEGQTLKSISKKYLGPDMECYVEALNGVKEAKVGSKLKIPELKLKKIKN